MRVLMLALVIVAGMAFNSYAKDAVVKAKSPAAAVPVAAAKAEVPTPAAAPVAAKMQQEEPKTIFSFQKELGLSDKQVTDLKAITDEMKKGLTDKSQEIMSLREDLNKMITAREDIAKIRKGLQRIADIQVDNTCMDLETSRKVEAILTVDQWSKWKSIQEAARAEAQMMQAQSPAQTK
ncbi:MAG: hypothetical protein HQL22_00455 [Candidatus Omnitrophica bacterium]|nr:hypothetical protein [Candidatus Omnitrophota bacterium]